MRAADLREKSPEDLRELHKSLVRDVFQNRLKNFTNRLDDTSSIRKTKRGSRMVTTIALLEEPDRLEELASMLRGESRGETTRKEAEAMLAAAKRCW